ncbi:hypothetical protein AADEFJLK_01336 [Methylovulum psychrotolerans]|uniref:Type IV pilin accessory protein n=2 Tax=Methylovulum psychrotolerans TaxID=1704499 RepID=A0A2S5CPJ3_9GAMM|nr:hypothetical protein AADEFJLK_01336 [Methylovulum psychrotolerans]
MLINIRKPKKRLTAAFVHFCISASAFSLIFLLMIVFWYPEPYFNVSGGWEGIKIVTGVDVVLGALLTFVVFSPTKPVRELVIDIGTIVVMQLTALFWGVYTLYDQRPVAVVFWESAFLTVPAQALAEQGYALNNLAGLSSTEPPIIYAEKPAKLEDLKKMLELIKKDKIPPHQQAWLYRPIKDHFNDIRPMQFDIDQIIAKRPDVKNQLLPIMQKHNISDIHAMLYFLLQSKYSNSVLVFDQNAQYLGYVNPE